MHETDDVTPDARAPARQLERVLRDRAEALARGADRGRRRATEVHLIAVVGDVTVAVPAGVVRHVVPVGHLARLPGSGPAIVGLSAALGRVIPVAGAAALLHVPAAPRTAGARLVLVDDGDDALLGILVDRVEELTPVDRDDVRPAVAPSSLETGLLAGVTSDGHHVLDVGAVLADPRLWPPGSPAPSRSEGT